jgi:hypothetical protein
MEKFRNSLKQMFAFKKSFVTILVIVSVLMSSTTFAYWSKSISGNSDEVSMTFHIGEYLQTIYDFIFNHESNAYEYEVDVEYLLEDYKNNEDNVVFGIVWNDPNLSDEYKDKIVNGEIKVSYDFVFYQNGEEVDSRTDRQLNRYILMSIDDNNPDSITYNGGIETFEFSIYLDSTKKFSKLDDLLKYDVYVEITYDITE